MLQVLIVGGGPVALEQLRQECAAGPDLIIAADYGGKYLLDIGNLPHVLIGDFDSLPPDLVHIIGKAGVELVPYPEAKDQTDLELAVDLALGRGATKIRILGGLGNRLDHTLGNIGLLLKAYRKGADAFLLDPEHKVTLTGERLKLHNKPGQAVSLIPLTLKVSGVTTTGLKFPLKDEELNFIQTRGIHNEFIEQSATISLKEGILLVVLFQER